MLIALYEIKSKPGREKEFEKAWAEVTDAIYEVRGSLGSRLHTTETFGLYIAYAQWPSRAVYDAVEGAPYSEAQQESGKRLREEMESFRTLHMMDVCDDRLHGDVMPSPH